MQQRARLGNMQQHRIPHCRGLGRLGAAHRRALRTGYCVPVNAVQAAPVTNNGVLDPARAANLKVTVYSAKKYVMNFMEKPVRGRFPKLNFVEAALNIDSALLADGSEVAVLFVNDDGTAPVIEVLANMGVKLIAMRCAGFDKVDLVACDKFGIKVVRVPTYSPTSVAEMAVALMFCLNRRLHNAYNRVLQGNYSLSGLVGFEMKGKVAGVLGTGAIGYEACRILTAIGLQVYAYDLYPNERTKALGVEYMDLEEMIPKCDIISIHCPLLPSTFHIINKERIALMKPGTMLINVSRGGLVDSDALFDGLEHGNIGALGLDVYENEASLFFEDWSEIDFSARMKRWDRRLKLLLSYPQVMMSPHSAFLTHEALYNIATTTAKNIEEYLTGKENLTNIVKTQS